MLDRVQTCRCPRYRQNAVDTFAPSVSSCSLDGQPLRVALVDRVVLVAADRSRCAVDEVPHRVDGIGLEYAHAPGAVSAGRDDWQLGSLRQPKLPTPERVRVG